MLQTRKRRHAGFASLQLSQATVALLQFMFQFHLAGAQMLEFTELALQKQVAVMQLLNFGKLRLELLHGLDLPLQQLNL